MKFYEETLKINQRLEEELKLREDNPEERNTGVVKNTLCDLKSRLEKQRLIHEREPAHKMVIPLIQQMEALTLNPTVPITKERVRSEPRTFFP